MFGLGRRQTRRNVRSGEGPLANRIVRYGKAPARTPSFTSNLVATSRLKKVGQKRGPAYAHKDSSIKKLAIAQTRKSKIEILPSFLKIKNHVHMDSKNHKNSVELKQPRNSPCLGNSQKLPYIFENSSVLYLTHKKMPWFYKS